MKYKDITNEFPKYMSTSSSIISNANTMSPIDLMYGVKMKSNKRTFPSDYNADSILCPICGRKAYKRIKVWEGNKREIFLCENCNKVFEETKIDINNKEELKELAKDIHSWDDVEILITSLLNENDFLKKKINSMELKLNAFYNK